MDLYRENIESKMWRNSKTAKSCFDRHISEHIYIVVELG
jgi:hypothetical protein